MAGEIIMSAAYGIDVKPEADPYVTLAEAAVHGLVTASVPGRFLVVSCLDLHPPIMVPP
jgi:hypothetical protein